MSDASLPARTQPLATGQDVVLRPSPPSSTTDPLLMLRAFQRRWVLAVFGGLVLGLLAGFVAYWFYSPKYTAAATLRVKMIRPKILFPTAEQDPEYVTFQKTQVDLIKSNRVLDKVVGPLGDPEVLKSKTIRQVVARNEDATQWLAHELVVAFGDKSEILQISLTGENAKELPRIVNGVVQAYMKHVVDVEKLDRDKRVNSLKDLWIKYEEDLKKTRDVLRKQASKLGSGDKEVQSVTAQLAQEQIKDAETERRRNQSEMVRLDAEIMVLEPKSPETAAEAPAPSEEAVDAAIENDEEVRHLKSYLRELGEHYKNLHRTVRNESDPALRALHDKMTAAGQSLSERRAQLRPVVERQFTQQLTQGGHSAEERDLEKLKAMQKVRKEYDKTLASEIEALKKKAEEHGKGTLEFQGTQEEFAVQSETAKKVKAEVEAMNVELTAPDRIEKIDEAREPKNRDELKKYRLSGMVASGFFFLVLVGVTFWEMRTQRVGSAREVTNSLGIRLVGSLPSNRENTRRGLTGPKAGGRDWLAVMIESIDATRMMLLHASRGEETRVILITSSVEGEGKTSLACNLAASLARAGRKTLLLDCDLRKSSLHQVFDVPRCPGISEVLLGEATLDSVIHPTSAADLSVIPAGKGGSETVQVLSRTDLHSIFDELKSRFDFVIIDSAPVLPVVDSLLLSQYTDTVLLSVLCEVSRIPSVQQAYDRLSNLGVRILGAVVAGTAMGSYGSGYAYSSTAADSKVEAEV